MRTLPWLQFKDQHCYKQQGVSRSRVTESLRPRQNSRKQLVARKPDPSLQSGFVYEMHLRSDHRVALDTISCSDLKPLVVYISRFHVAHSLPLSLVTTASLSVSPPEQRAYDWSIFLYLIAGDEQQ